MGEQNLLLDRHSAFVDESLGVHRLPRGGFWAGFAHGDFNCVADI